MASKKKPTITATLEGVVKHTGRPTLSSLVDFTTAVETLAADLGVRPDAVIDINEYRSCADGDYIIATLTTEVEF